MKIRVKHKATWLACAIVIGLEANALMHKPKPCWAGGTIGCDWEIHGDGSAVLKQPQGAPAQYTAGGGAGVLFMSDHSLSATRDDCPNNCAASVSWAFKNGYTEGGTVASASGGFSWQRAECNTQYASPPEISGVTVIQSPGTYTAWAKTLVDENTVAFTSLYFSVK